MIIVKILLWWVVISVTIGPLLTWMFFYPKRRNKKIEADQRQKEWNDYLALRETRKVGSA